MTDEGLHEVQLNGKQLVFLFMVGTVIAVVIFLCGVMVGRGLRLPDASDLASASSTSTSDPTESLRAPNTASSTASDGTPVSAQEALTYAARLGSPTAPPDDFNEPVPASPATPDPTALTPALTPAASSGATAATTAVPARAAPVPEAAGGAALPEPPGTGFVVQVMAVNTRPEAEKIAGQLIAKGYPTFVTTTGVGTAKVSYRVRVGKYNTQREADAVSARLLKEEQFKPWVTR